MSERDREMKKEAENRKKKHCQVCTLHIKAFIQSQCTCPLMLCYSLCLTLKCALYKFSFGILAISSQSVFKNAYTFIFQITHLIFHCVAAKIRLFLKHFYQTVMLPHIFPKEKKKEKDAKKTTSNLN